MTPRSSINSALAKSCHEALQRRGSRRRLTFSEMLDVPGFTEVVKNFVELYRVGIKVFDERGTKLARGEARSSAAARRINGSCLPSTSLRSSRRCSRRPLRRRDRRSLRPAEH
jgi:hypothetical protein